MEWLNYHHLFYFWTVARAGSIARASEELRLAQPTISNQLKTLEASLGVKLLERQGRRLVLTDAGRTVLRFADDIFRTGRELQRAVKGLPTGQGLRLVAGVVEVDALVIRIGAVRRHRIGAVKHRVARVGRGPHRVEQRTQARPLPLADRAPALDAVVARDLRARRHGFEIGEGEACRLFD